MALDLDFACKQSMQGHAELGCVILPHKRKGSRQLHRAVTLGCQPFSLLNSNITVFKCQRIAIVSMCTY